MAFFAGENREREAGARREELVVGVLLILALPVRVATHRLRGATGNDHGTVATGREVEDDQDLQGTPFCSLFLFFKSFSVLNSVFLFKYCSKLLI